MVDRWTDRLSEYLDDELDAGERSELERHLAVCPECTATVAELRVVVGRLAALPDVGPTHDLWPAIEARLDVAPGLASSDDGVISLAARRRRFSFTVPQLAAAAIAAIALSSGLAWLVASGAFRTGAATVAVVAPAGGTAPATSSAGPVASAPVKPAVGTPAGAGPNEPASAATALAPAQPPTARRTHLVSAPLTRRARAERDYQRAVGELEAVLRTEQSHLRPETVAALQKSLADIDRALLEARRALARDPGSVYLNAHLAETMRMKLEFLREAASLIQS